MTTSESSTFNPEFVATRVQEELRKRFPQTPIPLEDIIIEINRTAQGANVLDHIEPVVTSTIDNKLRPDQPTLPNAVALTPEPSQSPVTIFDRATHAAANIINTASRTLRLG